MMAVESFSEKHAEVIADPASARTSEGRLKKQARATRLEVLKGRDNYTNLSHLAFVYAVLATTIAGTIWAYYAIAAAGYSWWWTVPLTVVSVIIIGAGQHQFGGVIHEGTHYILFANRRFNELASDWLAAFPIYTSTYAFRLHHLAHHQFVNDPVRDPNFDQAKDSGHWLDFPIAHIDLLVAIVKMLWPPHLISYIAARVRYSAIGVDTNPYADKSKPGSPWSIRAPVLYAIVAPFTAVAFVEAAMPMLAIATVVGGWLAVSAFLWFAGEEAFAKSKIDPVISHRATGIGRLAYIAIVYTGLTLTNIVTGAPAWGFYGLLWILPLFTSFPLFMVLREWVQHGNADRGRYTNTRTFLVKNPFIRFAIFPWGMDYHLSHHLFASVPHYKLKELHAFLMEDPKYAEKGLIVEGWAKSRTPEHPTIVEVLGPGYAPDGQGDVHVDDATLADADVNDKAGLAAQIAASRAAGQNHS
ncbi:MAG: fatty acid desaturase family protein [Hyphomicrobiaceae bacterium]